MKGESACRKQWEQSPGQWRSRAHPPSRPKLDSAFHPSFALIFFAVLGISLFFIAYNVYSDVASSLGVHETGWLPYLLLGVALLIALGFEFVNGFHDTANAVATVIYTHSLPPYVAVIWSGMLNFIGVLASSGAVAFGVLALLPVELILDVGSAAGFAMVFAALRRQSSGTWARGPLAFPRRVRTR